MSTLTLRKAEYLGKRGGGDPVIREYAEAASQSFKANQMVYLASGLVTECADNAVVVMGMAMKDATTATTGVIPVQVFDPEDEVAICIYHGTAATAITAIAKNGMKYPLNVSNNKTVLDITDQTTPAWVQQEVYLPGGEAVGDIYGRVRASLLHIVCQALIGA